MWYAAERVYSYLPISLQNAVVAVQGARLRRERFGRSYESWSSFLEQSERGDPAAHRAYQDERLASLVRHAFQTVPHYREVMGERGLAPSDVTTVDDLAKMPILTKDDVRRAGDRLISSAFRKRALRHVTTSASTGSPLGVAWDASVSLANHACYMRARRWAGLPFGEPYATLQGRILVPNRQTRPPFWRYNPSWNQMFFSTLHMNDENLAHYVRKLREFRPTGLEAYPSSGYVLARFLASRGERLPLSCVITTGEPLMPHLRELMEEMFQTRVFDAYGQAERVVFSSECEEHNGHHLYGEYGVTEIVDDAGAPVPAGSPGLLVGTSLHNFAMPFIRYACGDVATASERRCPCGRTLPLLEGLTTREGDILVTPDGRTIPAIMISWAVRWLKDVSEWQIRQESVDDILVLIVSETEPEEGEREAVRQHFARRMGPGVRVCIERVPEIPRTGRGKLRHVVSSVPLPWGSEKERDRDGA